jgi:hypothetical protein
VPGAGEGLEIERHVGPGRQHDARTLPIVHQETLAVTAAADRELPAAADGPAVGRVDREQHPHSSLRVGTQHHQIAVGREFDADLDPVAGGEHFVRELQADRRIVGAREGGREQHGGDEHEGPS